MKLNFKMLWNFINLKLGDKLVTNKGRTLLLGVGEVTRGYQFMPDRSEYQHTVGVNYYKVCDSDTNLPVNLRGKFGKTITPLKEAEFLELEGMIQGSGNNEGYLMLSFKDGSPWDDEFGKSYHYGTNVHNYKKVNTGSRFLLYTKDMGFVGHGVVGDIKTESPDDGSTQFLRANYELFVPIDPPKQLDDEIKNKLKALENYNVRYSIKVVTKEIFDMVLDRDGGEPDKEKWINVKDKLSFQSLGEDFNIDTLHFQDTEKTFIIRRIKTELKNGKHIILIGPPGTGKSKLAKIICESYCGGDNYIMSAATSDWSTFETIGGYRPNEAGRLNFYPGIFLQCFRNYDNSLINKWLIIDEINRADIDKAFGSLFSALTGDDITLPYEVYREQLKVIGKPTDETVITDNLFIVPPDWRIIATMNTFDKASLYEMSYAFMRRFAFVPVDVPKLVTPDLLKEYVNIWGFEIIDEICSNISEIWKTINKRRKVGPAIIKDIYAYIINTEPYDYVSSIIMYVLPQFEGLMEDDQVEFIKEIKSLGIIGNTEELRNFSSEFFGVDIRKFD